MLEAAFFRYVKCPVSNVEFRGAHTLIPWSSGIRVCDPLFAPSRSDDLLYLFNPASQFTTTVMDTIGDGFADNGIRNRPSLPTS